MGPHASFTVSIPVQNANAGTYVNPAASGVCAADPDNLVDESDETNNACSADSVTVGAPDLQTTASHQTDGLPGAALEPVRTGPGSCR
jgi:hypothetical protein